MDTYSADEGEAQEVEGLCGLSGKSSGRAGLPESGA
jgi:hypothetical protein